MLTATTKTAHDPKDLPFLVAVLVGAKRQRDRALEAKAREWLAELGVKVTFIRDCPAVRPLRLVTVSDDR